MLIRKLTQLFRKLVNKKSRPQFKNLLEHNIIIRYIFINLYIKCQRFKIKYRKNIGYKVRL